MQQSVMEENSLHGSEPRSYNDLFPALPTSASAGGNYSNNPMRVTSSKVTQVFSIPSEELKLDGDSKFGEGESIQTCSNIMKDTGAHIEISHSKDHSLTFLINGKLSDVLKAKVKILMHFQTQAHKSIQIPKEHHKWILGKKGERLRELEAQTLTKISVPNIKDDSDVITITGPKEGIEKAEHEIRITSDLQSKKAQETVIIPKIYHPFIVGPFNENLNQLTAETGSKITVPPPSVNKDEIYIAGEKEGVAAAKVKIEELHHQMEKKCSTVSVEVPKNQHKYVIGTKGATINEILQETGVSVEMPPTDSSVDTINLRGPREKLGQALGMVYDKANSVQFINVSAPAWLHKYIIGKKGQKINEITQQFRKVYVEFSEKEDKIRIEGPPEEIEQAHEQIEAIAIDLIQNMTFVEMNVASRLFKHIIGKAGANVNKLKDDYNVAINIDTDSGVIRIEGRREDVANTEAELSQRIFKLENETERDVIIEQRHFKNIIGTKGESIREIRNRFNQVQIVFPDPGDRNDNVKVRGPKEDVDNCVEFLERKVKELGETSYQIQVPIHKQFHRFIIGKGGAKIKKIREETNTKIELPAENDTSDCITITGKKENVEQAQNMIQTILEGLVNIVSEEITIDPKFYHSLIGAKGKLIHAIMEECGGVIVKFPDPDSKSDIVTIRGSNKEEVDRAKQQLLDLANEKQLASFTAEVRAKPQHHKFLIGRNGAKIKKIRDSTGARIVFPSNAESEKEREIITIIGKKEAVLDAKQQLESVIKDLDNIIEDEIQVEQKYHKHFVARQGEVLHRVSDECGGVMISFPRAGIVSDRVVLKGSKECIDAVKQKITDIIADLKAMITMECVIAQKHHRTVMGSRGSRLQEITSRFDVQIKFPEQNQTEEYQSEPLTNGNVETEPIRQCDIIKINGKEENCLLAKQALLDLIPISIFVDVPFEMHRSIIGAKGKAVKDLMTRYDVHIVLSAQDKQENLIEVTGSPVNVENAKMALLQRVEELEAEKKDRELKSFTLEIDVNPDYHPKIIGKRGAGITKIRRDHDVQIQFPERDDETRHTVRIIGYPENAEAAKEDILKIVRELDSLVREKVLIDARVHSRLIGIRRRAIRKIMDEYRVDIKFPRSTDPDPDEVIISGHEDDVRDAKEYLLNITEEYLQDIEEMETREKLHTLNALFEAPGGAQGGQAPAQHQRQPRNQHRSNGFVVQGAPWEQSAPNTASVSEFPLIGHSAVAEPPPAPVAGAWGNRR